MEKYEINRLLDRINTLETENSLLKKRLEAAGISYEDIIVSGQSSSKSSSEQSHEYTDGSEPYDPDQGARILPIHSCKTMVR